MGRRIGSAALMADGLHARVDGFTALAVLISAAGVALGFPLVNPIIGLVIAVAILAMLRTTAREIFRRLLDGVDPEIVDDLLAASPGVKQVHDIRMRWIGHRLPAEAEVDIEPATSLSDAHRIAHGAEHTLIHNVPSLRSARIHAYPLQHHSVGAQHEH